MKKLLCVGLAAMSMGANAAYMGMSAPMASSSPWSYGIGLGFTKHRDMILNTGESVLGRLFVATKLSQMANMNVGLELGMQTGNDARLELTTTQDFDLGNVAVQAFIKPMADLLVTLDKQYTNGVGGFVKAGVAYRQMHFDRDTINTLREFDPEVQVGISKKLTNRTTLSIAYQGVYSGKMDLTTTNLTGGRGEGTGAVSNVPSQHGVLLTISAVA